MGKEEKEERSEAEIRETGSVSLDENRKNHRIKLLTIIGEIEGHEAVSGNTKQRNMNIFFRCLQKLRTVKRWMDC